MNPPLILTSTTDRKLGENDPHSTPCLPYGFMPFGTVLHVFEIRIFFLLPLPTKSFWFGIRVVLHSVLP